MRLPPPIPNLRRPGRLGASLARCIHIALLFVSHFFLGTFVAAWGSYQYEQSHWFSSLREQGKLLLDLRVTRLASRAQERSTPDSLERDISRLQTVRRRAPQDVQPILALRIASDRALLARLYSNAGNAAAAAAQSEAASSHLRELGWKDTSEATLNELAERRLQNIGPRDVR